MELEYDSDDSSQGQYQRSHARLTDFPLHIRDIGLDDPRPTGNDGYDQAQVQGLLNEMSRIQQSVERERERAQAFSSAVRHSIGPAMLRPPSSMGTGSSMQPHHSIHPPSRFAQTEQRAPIYQHPPANPVVTLVSALPATTYKDENDKTPKTTGYIAAQLAALKWLQTNTADQFTPAIACALTQAIDPLNKEPGASEALRFCYYMRSIGFDVYHELETKNLFLYVVHHDANVRGGGWGRDKAYWMQNFNTNRTQHQLAHAQASAPRTARRNAIPTFQDVLAMQSGSNSSAVPATPPPVPQGAPHSARTTLETRLAEAQARVQSELGRANPRPE